MNTAHEEASNAIFFSLIASKPFETRFIAFNTVNNRFWDGKGFTSVMIDKAKTLTEVEAIVVKNTYLNVGLSSFDLETAI